MSRGRFDILMAVLMAALLAPWILVIGWFWGWLVRSW